MLGNRDELDEELGDVKKRIVIESLRFLRENEPEEFEKRKEKLEGTGLWRLFQKEYG